MNLVEPGITVSVWDEWGVETLSPSLSAIPQLSLFYQTMNELLSVQPMTGECGNLFKMRYEPKMLGISELPTVD